LSRPRLASQTDSSTSKLVGVFTPAAQLPYRSSFRRGAAAQAPQRTKQGDWLPRPRQGENQLVQFHDRLLRESLAARYRVAGKRAVPVRPTRRIGWLGRETSHNGRRVIARREDAPRDTTVQNDTRKKPFYGASREEVCVNCWLPALSDAAARL